ncbi:acetyl-CoA synthetase-like protein [Lentithecium fluviatile CBS 122367]|uniref:Acetyl-CoA synthetase-like protein n=1 Tax=Lentithecium fluviatile CBS 122367 TaxID=1168545 RepID=A0A6G1J9V2_9PLEO|nr:acetyl-CoA synthetase-like protein [Lentithecium fluviatile CBS 122367]
MSFWNTVMDAQGEVRYGQRLIPSLIDDIAANDPDRVCFSFPQTANLQDGLQNLTFRIFANAINKTAHFIQREIGRSSMFETVMYMGYPDVRHFIVLIALIKTGHKALFSSHRNSVAVHADLIKRTDCAILLHTAGFPVSGILETCRMESLCMPDLEYLLDDSPFEGFPYDKTWEEAKNHPVMVVDTLGSTGLPKPVVWTHWTLSTGGPYRLTPPIDGRPTLWGVFTSCKRAYMALPIFRGAGIGIGISVACFTQTTIVLGLPGQETADTLKAIFELTDLDAINARPATLEEVATRPDIMARFNRLEFVAVVGGALSNGASEKLSQHVRIYTLMANTEPINSVQSASDP